MPETMENGFQVAVDTVIFTLVDRDLKICLTRRDHELFAGNWSLPGCLLRLDESLDSAAQRQIEDTLHISKAYLQQLYTFGDPERDPRRRVVSVAYFALVSKDRLTPTSLKDTSGSPSWHSVYALPPLAFDHAEILNYALTRLRYKIEYSAVGFRLMPPEFTLSELQKAYEIVLGEPLDKRNFRRRIMEAQVIEPLDEVRSGEGRPARLYRFRPDAVSEVKARRLFP